MTTLDENKQALRTRMRDVRKSIPTDERTAMDRAICDHVCATSEFKAADVVFTYLSMGTEVDTRGIIDAAWHAGKAVAIPRCVGTRQMRWFRIDSFDGLETSSFGVEEPPIDPATEQLATTGQRMVALVPGMTFDRAGYRLGYGGGFYDTFLADFPGASLGLCRSIQMVDDLKAEGVIGEYDRHVDTVVTD